MAAHDAARPRTRPWRGGIPALCSGLAAAVLGGCGSAASTPAAAPATSPNPANTIIENWQEFFAGATPAARKIALLQNGSTFAAVINTQASSPLAKGSGARVTKVAVTGSSTATVRYTITLGGKPALSNQTGTAVLQSGTWKVGDASFCSLLELEGQHLPQCGAAASPSP